MSPPPGPGVPLLDCNTFHTHPNRAYVYNRNHHQSDKNGISSSSAMVFDNYVEGKVCNGKIREKKIL
jgi:hypothetical protein